MFCPASRILAIRKDKIITFAFEAGDIVCWLVNPPIAKLDLFKSADWRWISKSYAEYCYRNSATVRRLVQSPAMQSTIFCGCPSDLRGKGIRRECHPDPLDSVFDERSFGQPMCLHRYAIRNETGNKKKKKLVRNKAIPSRAREPAALSIYAPLRRFHLVVLFTVLWSKMWHSFRMKYLRITQFN